MGAGLLASVAARSLFTAALAEAVNSLALWTALVVPVAMAFRRGRPRGLLAFRATDLLYGLALGLLLRVLQGWFAVAAGDDGGLPSFVTLDGHLPAWWPLNDILAPVVLAPLVEELLFRGVVLVAVFRIARRGLEGALLAAIASTAAFVALHAVDGIARWDEPVSLTLVGLVCCALVLLTGRIWGAVLVHAVYNAGYVALAVVGTILG